MFKDILINLMLEKGINQKELSECTGIAPTTISGWISSNRLPDYSSLKKLRTYFCVTADYLLGLENEDGTEISTEIKKEVLMTGKKKHYTFTEDQFNRLIEILKG